MNSVTPGADVPTFRRRWRGYDRTEVDECLSQMIADRRRPQESLARVDALMANSPQERASAIVAEAKHQAEEIYAQAEQRSRRLMQETADQAEVLRDRRPRNAESLRPITPDPREATGVPVFAPVLRAQTVISDLERFLKLCTRKGPSRTETAQR